MTKQEDARRCAQSAGGPAATSGDRCGRAGAVGRRRPKAVLHDEGRTSARARVGEPGRWRRCSRRGNGSCRARITSRGVRPEVAISWHRCREQYRVDPHLTEAPVAVAEVDHTPEHDVVFAELGVLRRRPWRMKWGASSGVVTVTDATGRILAAWGDQATLARATDSNLAPWFCWSECAAGTNGMGTALEAHGPVLIRGAEHWCQAFHNWVCAGIAVRDVVTREPIAVPEHLVLAQPAPRRRGRLAGERGHPDPVHVEAPRPGQRRRAGRRVHPGEGRFGTALAAVDTAGKVVIADEHGGRADGRPGLHPGGRPHGALEPRPAGTDRRRPVRQQAGGPQPRLDRLDADLHPPGRRADGDQHPAGLPRPGT